jgi:membrane protease YdiL (CAAX protease family)
MDRADEQIARHRDRRDIPAHWPIAAPLVLLAVALCLRITDIFVLRLDERLGEIILSKSLGFALVVWYALWVGQRLSAIGLHARHLRAALAIGAGLILTAFAIASVVQVLTLAPGQSLILRTVDPRTGMTGGVAFVLFLIIGNVINVLMEEGLFRGIMLPHFLQRMRFARANLLQAALFSIWHLVWPVKAWLSGDASAATAFAQAGVLLSGAFIAGLVFGYLFWRTGSLYAPMIAHFVNNMLNNLLHVQGAEGTLQPAVALSVVVVVAMVPLALAVGPIARRLGLPGLQPGWGLTVR